MSEAWPDGYSELLPIIADRLEAFPGSAEEAVAAGLQREFRKRYLQTHSLSDYVRLVSQTGREINAVRGMVTPEDIV